VQGNSPLGIPGTETPKRRIYTRYAILGIRKPGFWDMQRQEVTHLGFPGAETPKHQTPNMLHYFRVSSIEISQVGILRVEFPRLVNTWGPHFGTPGAEIPKYNNFSTLYLFGILGLASTREFALGYSGCRNTEISGFSYTLSFRDFACRDFGTCEYKGTRT
jgi:hypothetical protein